MPACRIGSATGQEFRERPPDAMRPDDMIVEGPSEDGEERAQPSAGPQKVFFLQSCLLKRLQRNSLKHLSFLASAGSTRGICFLQCVGDRQPLLHSLSCFCMCISTFL